MFSMVYSACIQGLEGQIVSVEADMANGLPTFLMVGILASEVKEARERVHSALGNAGYLLPPKRITVSLTPADMRKRGAGFDLPIAAAVLAAMGRIPDSPLKNYVIVGELSLDGRVRGIPGILPIAEAAKKAGFPAMIVPAGCEGEAVLSGIEQVEGVACLEEMVELLTRGKIEKKRESRADERLPEPEQEKKPDSLPLDFSDVGGQEGLKRAALIAAAGFHNILFVGPPGSGKTLIASRIPGILPPLSMEEKLSLTKIYSVCGLLPPGKPLVEQRPFRKLHHTATAKALVGGGALPRPGEMSLAQFGVLFLDELSEFPRGILDVLRQPLEEGRIQISRLNRSIIFPADCMLAAAMNPCPCGYFPDRSRCRCSRADIGRYMGRISRPLMERIDLCVEAKRPEFEDFTASRSQTDSKEMKRLVEEAWRVQRERFQGTQIRHNSRIPPGKMEEYCSLGKSEKRMMKEIYESMSLSVRVCHKILKVARTIADMDKEERIREEHLAEAAFLRNADQWYQEGQL